MSARAATDAESLAVRGFAEVRKSARRLLDVADSLAARLVDLDRSLSRVPEREAIAGLLEARAAARARVQAAEEAITQLDEELERAQRAIDEAQARVQRLIEKQVRADYTNAADHLLLRRSALVRARMGAYRGQLLEMHVSRIETRILESFQSLLRKKSLVSQIRIDRATFRLDVFDSKRRVLEHDRLSAGERQLLAVSMLWGLAKSSGRRLPTVIDTPLGRLDSKHQGLLVDRYFPRASHQVMLLSTDEEIVGDYLNRLRPHIGRSYQLVHDEQADATHVEPGYF